MEPQFRPLLDPSAYSVQILERFMSARRTLDVDAQGNDYLPHLHHGLFSPINGRGRVNLGYIFCLLREESADQTDH
jgi:hypothetical protein